jgi:uncharacterized protein (DUF4415 family)
VDMAEVADSPEWTDEDFAAARPARELLPAGFLADVQEQRRRRGRQTSKPVKRLVSLRLDPDVLDQWKASGPGWQSRINEALRAAAPEKKAG